MKEVERSIRRIVNSHMGLPLFLALSPTVLFLIIGSFEEAASKAIPFVATVSTIIAVAYLIRNVLIAFYMEFIDGSY